MVDLGADGDPDQSLSHQQRIGDLADSTLGSALGPDPSSGIADRDQRLAH
jgi:hypothetical protein